MDISPIINALLAHNWVIVGALFVGLVVALTKQGWFGTWIQDKIPARYLPIYAMGVGVLSLMGSEVLAGKTWQQALMDGFSAAFLAVVGHQTVIEGVRDGKELVPYKLPPLAVKPQNSGQA